ncbi:MAG: putative toxin-antitoxin system toxin component, PIN family [Scytonema sp. PMC 1069.18]|nr:putative toxin-antitoxin system toxin component, PIN family [Scytonema sp. PMC 1069.18]MEC4886967.1 putative toxin-antitoxin system toxin component, PIN family [Scytonema sp. PMC 1070.18]
MFVVFDTNVLVSYCIGGTHSTVVRILKSSFDVGCVNLFSDQTYLELFQVLHRQKFDKFISREIRIKILEELRLTSLFVEINETFTICRDEKDNKFLDVAWNGDAEFIITGDEDLLTLSPFQGIPILNPSQFYSILPCK